MHRNLDYTIRVITRIQIPGWQRNEEARSTQQLFHWLREKTTKRYAYSFEPRDEWKSTTIAEVCKENLLDQIYSDT